MDFSSICIILIGTTFGLKLRILIKNNFKKSIGFDIQNTSIVNFLSAFFLGILVALNFINNEILVLFYSGFLGCFSTFSSFIYQLFILFKKSIGFDIQNTSIVNFLSSFFLGILVALDFINNEILALFYSGFLGCFSTFSSFIYQLFILFQKRKFLRLFLHYFEVIIISFICFYIGFNLMQIVK